MGIATIRGSFADYDAVIDGGDEPRISGAIRVASVDTRDEARDGHLQSPTSSTLSATPRSRSPRPGSSRARSSAI